MMHNNLTRRNAQLHPFAAHLQAKWRFVFFVVLTVMFGLNNTVMGQTFASSAVITGTSGNATPAPYPSTIAVSGLAGTISGLTIDVQGITSASLPGPFSLLLVGPLGENIVLLAGTAAQATAGPSNVELFFSDQASTFATNGNLNSGTYKPTSYVPANYAFPSPAPSGPYNLPGSSASNPTLSSIFNGASPNGTWRLYAVYGSNAFTISSWAITITQQISTTPTTTTVTSNPNPSFITSPNNSVTLTAEIGSAAGTVNEGTVTFTANGKALGAATVSGGVATLNPSFSTAGTYNIQATYNANSTYLSSTGSLTQQVNIHPTTINSIIPNSAFSNGSAMPFTVTFGASITGLSTGNFNLTTTGAVSGASVASVSGSGSTYTVTVNTGTGDGMIVLNLANATGLTPGISTNLPFSGGGTIDKTPPVATIGSPSATTVGNSGTSSVSYNVNYADANFGSSNLTASGITLNTTGTASGTVSVTGSGTSYVVTISHILGVGTLGISVAGGYATDLAGNTDTGAGASQTVNVSGDILPSISSVTPASGPVGTLVIISGTNLTAPTAFTIGGVPAIVVSNNGNTLVGMVMPGAVTGPVSFTSNGGTAGSGANFTVTATLYPSLQQGSKLVGTGNTGNAEEGISVAVSADGNTAIAGGNFDNSSRGAAWVYTRSGGIWTQQGSKLLGNDAVGSATDQGNSVAISADGNTAIVGGFGDNNNQGAAWVYTRSGGTWTQQGPKLVGTGVAGSYGAVQGYSVAISADGNTAIVGGYYDNSGVGAVWVYTRSGGTWTQQGAKLVGSGAVGSNVYQGWSVSLSADGNTAVAGGFADNNSQGAAWVYTRSGGVWTQQGAKLVGTGATGNAGQGFSVSLSADGNTAIVGGKSDNSSVGAAWVYTRSGGVWSQQGSKLVGTGAVGAAEQGVSVSLTADGNTAMVGGWFDNNSQGAAWVYTRSGGVWTQQGAKLVGTGSTGSSSEQGSSVSLSADGNTAIAGGFGDNSSLGAAWAYISLPAPTVQAGNVIFTNTTTLATTASWTNGNGSSRAVFMYAGSSGSPAPVNNTAYIANAAFGTGDQVGGTGWYCVYNGTGNTVNITGLSIGTTYQLMVVEYNGPGSNVKYLTTAGTGNPAGVTTLPPQPPTIAGFTPTSGPVGTLVTISGTNLIAAAGLTIGGVPAIIISDKDNTLVGMVMPGAATGPVSITAAGGMAAGGSNFKVTATLYPSLQQGSKLVGTGSSAIAGQGASVAVSADGNTAIVGGPSDNSNVGAVWIYTRTGGVWTQQGPKLVDNNNIGPYGAAQGTSVAISADGNTALAGGYNAAGAGAVWVYTRSGGTWTQQGSPLVGTDALAGSYSGASVSLSADGNTAIAGDYGGYSYYHGAAWIYTRSGGTWTQQGPKLVFTDAAVNSGQGSSVSLSADGNTAIVGGYADNSSQGAAWVFSRSGGVWTQQGSKLVGTGAVGAAAQGTSVAISADGNTSIIGGAHDNSYIGATWVYTRSAGVWTQQGLKLVGKGAAGKSGQGTSVSLSSDGNTAIVGAESDYNNQGAAWVYTRNSGTWTQRGPKLVGTDATSGAYIGASVSLSADGNTAMTGGFGDNNSLGAAWAYISLQAPTAQAGNLTFTGTTKTATTAGWTNGNGTSRAVFMFAGSSGSPAPVNNTAYNANAAFGTGDQVGSTGWYCVYNGTGNTVHITGLTKGTTYQLMVIEYNGTSGNIRYLTTQSTGNPASVTSLSDNANLIGLSVSAGTLTPAFTTATTSYTASVPNSVTSVTVTPTTADATATVTINVVAVNSGIASGAIPLSVGPNTITTVSTAQDGVTTKTYTITITRSLPANPNLSNLTISAGTLTPAFATATINYTASVANSVSSITVTPKASDALATITVNGTAVSNNTASGAIPLNVGSNVITTVVTAQNGTTTKTYTVTVTRAASSNADLSNLSLSSGTLTPVFASGTTSYNGSVVNSVTSVTVTPTTSDATATLTVNGTAVSSGTASGAIALNVGPNTITTVVTAQDGTTKTYTVTLTRMLPANANLSGLAISAGALTPAFATATTSYTLSVANAVTSTTVTPKASDALATITVNGVAVNSGTASGAIALNVGTNVITTIVTAQNGTTTKTYTVTVTRAAGSLNSVYEPISVTNPAGKAQMMGEELVVRQGLSPNGDGINDFLQIDGITNYPDNKLTIMNRSGQLIFEAKGYDNSTKVFDGHSNKTGAMQLPGTYFYSLDFTVNGTTKHRTGFIILKY
ncbi:cadherin-like beta sandwich domain-containing protein [Mucilaginibacter gotjawali]|uniref:Gliding motility-associated-like protein n=1 Tax=Mucilaginibacter gotjawali TaxID=1550579 RepID=A0A839SKR7_9SPHI|nr:cadherin-like beta sandwich domain-containing protein [Mucilaginibacter gotjawali]MBB3058875.1 gliding motility-associated-like protein [Mucilaginibacter gotjawali]